MREAARVDEKKREGGKKRGDEKRREREEGTVHGQSCARLRCDRQRGQ